MSGAGIVTTLAGVLAIVALVEWRIGWVCVCLLLVASPYVRLP